MHLQVQYRNISQVIGGEPCGPRVVSCQDWPLLSTLHVFALSLLIEASHWLVFFSKNTKMNRPCVFSLAQLLQLIIAESKKGIMFHTNCGAACLKARACSHAHKSSHRQVYPQQAVLRSGRPLLCSLHMQLYDLPELLQDQQCAERLYLHTQPLG